MANLSSFHILFFMFITTGGVAASATEDSCPSAAWQGTLSRKDDKNLGDGGFQLNPGASVQLTDSSEWSGRIWGRRGCEFDSSGHGSCDTRDCGVDSTCSRSGPDSSVTMAEFTHGEKDSYDMRLVDGTNVRLGVKPQGDNNYLITFCPATGVQDSPQDYVSPHNQARQAVGVGPVQWDAWLAAYAQSYADRLRGDCRLVRSGGPYGESLAMSSGALTAVSAVNLWVSEKANYNYPSNTCSGVCSHYTQVVWRKSVRIGCGKARCNNGGTIISCNYDPPGNYVNEKPY